MTNFLASAAWGESVHPRQRRQEMALCQQYFIQCYACKALESATKTQVASQWYCSDCLPLAAAWRRRAVNLVSMAKRRGDLLPAAEYDCRDCGNPARDYEHRDYERPLDVRPVCRSCNKLNGPAKFPQRLPERWKSA